jgi:hypothetical protein
VAEVLSKTYHQNVCGSYNIIPFVVVNEIRLDWVESRQVVAAVQRLVLLKAVEQQSMNTASPYKAVEE